MTSTDPNQMQAPDAEATQTAEAPPAPLPERPPLAGKADDADALTASQWTLMLWKFRKHKVAVWSGLVLIVLYAAGLACEFVAPYTLDYRNAEYAYAPPQRLRIISEDGLHFRPFVYGMINERHPVERRRVYQEDRTQRYPVQLFARGETYSVWGLFETNIHLFGVGEPVPVASAIERIAAELDQPPPQSTHASIHLLGTDSIGHDLFSRILYGSRVSLTIGLVGVSVSFVLGLIFGSISGYFGGLLDNVIQRVIEIIQAFPTLPLWMALAAILPSYWSPLVIYFGITVVLGVIGWTTLARQVRGKILSLREEDFAMAASLAGASKPRIMFRHLLPSFMSHIIVSLTLTVPAMILGETALSFLGLGLRPPVTSWGVLLQEAQNVQAVALQPWLLTPAIAVVVAVLAFNFVGDGLRDAADPYSR
ncbi:MAG: ABC transporter permease [Phycisphaeraceae bacterium]